MFEVKNLTKVYDDGTVALKNVSFEVPDRAFMVVIGLSGSGKSTLAGQLAEILDCPHIELDALHWGPGWTPVPLELFRERTAQALGGEAWTTDGNYSKVRDIVWGRADTVVWLAAEASEMKS